MRHGARRWKTACLGWVLGVAAVAATASAPVAAEAPVPGEAPATAAAPRADQLAFRDLYRELIETNTSHSIGSCTAAAEKMAVRLRAAGYPDSDLHPFAVAEHPKDGGLVAVLPGTDHSAKAILLLAHLDVVEARREDWTRDPFTLIEEGGYFYGRGTFDDKSMAAVWVDTLIRLRQEGYKPKRPIKMALTCGEEMGAAMKALADNVADAKAAAVLSQDPRYNAMLRTTCVATMADAGHATNALPQRARANINCRIFPGVGIEDVRRTLAGILADPQISVTTVEPSDPVVLPPPLTPAIMKPIEQVTRRIYPGIQLVPVLQAAGTDAIYLAESGIPTYGLSGMFVDPDLGNIHGLNERIRVRSLYDGRDFLYALVKIYAEQVR
jgi:acetylornithine deacetylase/succinyl-diaminopimelate desuccinylase-like protein